MIGKQLIDYIDGWGLVVTKEKDGGDTCAHHFCISYCNDGGQVYFLIKSLEKAPGRYVRHPDTTKWYSDLDRLSRDQFTPLLLCLGLVKQRSALYRLFKAHLWRGLLFTWNTRKNAQYPTLEEHKAKNTVDTWDYAWKLPDLTGPEIWAAWIRAFRLWPLWPLLWPLDMHNLLGSMQKRYMKTDNIQMNHVLMTDYASRIMPTPVSLLSRWVYGKKVAIAALRAMWGDQEYQPPVDEFLIPLINKWPVRE